MKTTHALLVCLLLLLAACEHKENDNHGNYSHQPAPIERLGNTSSLILKGVKVPAGHDLFFSSGLVAPVIDTTATAANTPARYGGKTYQQGIAALKRLQEVLAEAGLGMKDVITLKVYIVPDPDMGGNMDFDGWNKAYQAYFANQSNPEKVARTTLGVATLARPGIMVEVEAVAVYPTQQ